MKKMIVTTSINPVTDAIKLYDAMEDWELLVIGDKKTPVDYYSGLLSGKFLPWTYVEATYPDLVRLIGWNSVRLGRMVAFIEAYRRGADILASVDDDVMPDDDWGKNVVLGKEVKATECIPASDLCFDPWFDAWDEYYQWPRGYPIEEIGNRRVEKVKRNQSITPLVQVDFCRGDSDVDATFRIAGEEEHGFVPQCDDLQFADMFSPINTQNTFIHRSVIKDFYANIPFIGRADDIWAGYIFQALHQKSTIYGPPSATHEQERTIQSIVDDLEDEIFMYRNTYKFLQSIKENGVERAMAYFLPNNALMAIEIYRSYFE